MVDVSWWAHHDGWNITPHRLSNSESSTTILSTFSFCIWWSGGKDSWQLSKDNLGGIHKQDFSRRWQMLLLHEGFCLFIYGGDKPIPIRVFDPQKSAHIISEKVGTHPKIPIKSAGYQPFLPHDLSHYGFRIRKDVSHRFHANLLNWHASCHLSMQSPDEIYRFVLMARSSLSPISRRIQSIQRSSTNSALLTFLW